MYIVINFDGNQLHRGCFLSGDPLCVHSSFIAKIINWNEPITMSDLVVAGRLGGKVKKQTLLCSVYPQDDTTVQYLTLNWSGSGTNI